jgi:hypothetical protein
MDNLEFESFGIKFKVTNIETSLRNFYISQKIDPSNDSEVVFYLKNTLQAFHVSHCDSLAEERPILEMSFVMELAENNYFTRKNPLDRQLTTSLSSLLLN